MEIQPFLLSRNLPNDVSFVIYKKLCLLKTLPTNIRNHIHYLSDFLLHDNHSALSDIIQMYIYLFSSHFIHHYLPSNIDKDHSKYFFLYKLDRDLHYIIEQNNCTDLFEKNILYDLVFFSMCYQEYVDIILSTKKVLCCDEESTDDSEYIFIFFIIAESYNKLSIVWKHKFIHHLVLYYASITEI